MSSHNNSDCEVLVRLNKSNARNTDELNQLRESGESKYIEYKESGDLVDQDEILKKVKK